MNKGKLIFNLIQNVFVGLAVTITVTLMTTGFTTATNFLIAFLKAYLINFIACIAFPIENMSILTCKAFKIDKAGKLKNLIQVLYCDLIYVTVISVVMFVWELGFTQMAFQTWKMTYIPLLIVGFVVGFIMGPISIKISNYILRRE